jgi:hypothetical protein
VAPSTPPPPSTMAGLAGNAASVCILVNSAIGP